MEQGPWKVSEKSSRRHETVKAIIPNGTHISASSNVLSGKESRSGMVVSQSLCNKVEFSQESHLFTFAFTRQLFFFLVILPHLLSIIADVKGAFGLHDRGVLAIGVYASDTFLQKRLFGLDKAASFAAQESFQEDQQPSSAFHQHPFFVGSNENLTGLSFNADENGNLAFQNTHTGAISLQEVNEQRWGQTSAYMPTSNLVIFTGGQVRKAEDGAIRVTNDVFSLNIGNGTIANGYGRRSSEAAPSRWQRISSNALPPHAFAARAVTHTGNHQGEKVFIIGGATADCGISNSPIYAWKSDNQGIGRWSKPNIAMGQHIPPRRRGMSAVQVPVAIGLNSSEAEIARQTGGSSIMVLGGYMDYTTCNNSIPDSSRMPDAYQYVDIWTTTKDKKDEETMSVRTLPIDPRMPNMSIYDYSAVVIPANETAKQNTRVMFVGGRDAYGAFTPMNRLWLLDIETNIWQRIDTTNGSDTGLDIPLGRYGHSATLMDDGAVLVHGGFVTLDNSQPASNDTYLLDTRVEPAIWHKLYPESEGGSTVGKAYHSAIMADGIYLVAFGQENTDESSQKSASLKRRANSISDSAPSSSVYYLDTRSTEPWRWTTDLDSILISRENRGDTATSTSSSNPPLNLSSPSPSSTAAQNTEASKDEQAQSIQQSEEQQTASTDPSPVQETKPANTPPNKDGEQEDDGSSDGGSSSKTKNTAVIASVVGALAVVASLGGLYAARKRRSARNSDTDSVGDDDKYERFTGDHGAPPVSSLWINQPMAWAENASKGLKRQASMATERFLARALSKRNIVPNAMQNEAETSPTRMMPNTLTFGEKAVSQTRNRDTDSISISSAATYNPANVFRSLPLGSRFSIRRAKYQSKERCGQSMTDENEFETRQAQSDNLKPLSDDFIKSLLDDGDFLAHSNIRRTVGGGKYLQSPHGNSPWPANPSRESFFSEDGVSHYSYPYLATINRSSMAASHSTRSSTFTPTSSQAAGIMEDDTPLQHYENIDLGEPFSDDMVRIKQDPTEDFDTGTILQAEQFLTPTIDSNPHIEEQNFETDEKYGFEGESLSFSQSIDQPSPLVQKKSFILQTPNRQDGTRDWFRTRLPFYQQPTSTFFMNPHPALLSIAAQKVSAVENVENQNRSNQPLGSLRIRNEE